MNKAVMFSSKTDQWSTPQEFFDRLNEEFHFTLDPCADAQNHKCEKFFTKEQNGLLQSWSGERVFCNPPYGRETQHWVKKCFEEVCCGSCKIAVMLIPARTDTQWFHKYIYQKAEIRFIRGSGYCTTTETRHATNVILDKNMCGTMTPHKITVAYVARG